MSPFFAAIFLLGLCLANAVNLTYVYEWSQFDFIWPPAADTSNEQMKQNFNPDYVEPHFIAVFGERLFLSLDSFSGIPASLVWLPTSGMSTVRPKLSPFPSWHLHKKDKCDTIQWAYGLEVDTDGRLWVLDNGRGKCSKKLWIFDLLNNDTTERIHQFPDTVVSDSEEDSYMSDIVLDKTPDDYLAYITAIGSQHIVVYSRKMDKSWTVKTPGRKWQCLALSPNREERKLYLARDGGKELYSVSVSELRNEGGSAAVKLISELTEFLYIMLFDNADVMYAAYYGKNYVFTWNISEPFREQRFHEVKRQGASVPFTFALDTDGNLWITERYVTGIKNRHYKLLKAAVGARSYQFIPSTALFAASTTSQTFETIEKSTQTPESQTGATPPTLESNETCEGVADFSEDHLKSQSLNRILIWLLVCCLICLVLSGAVIAWLTLRMRKMQTSLKKISKEHQELLPSSGETRP
ncbi:protein yellow-like [Cloeon dipterum]|uniref:protein yellow-like n=1 Tax=Cloeon dipterum TaxID=197152 RepID=UPI00321FD67A